MKYTHGVLKNSCHKQRARCVLLRSAHLLSLRPPVHFLLRDLPPLCIRRRSAVASPRNLPLRLRPSCLRSCAAPFPGRRTFGTRKFDSFSFERMASSNNTDAVNEDKSGKTTHDKNIEWLASLNEQELDFLISLRELAALRAKNIGHKDLVKKFDIKVFRALAFVLLEYLKDRVKNTRNDRSHNFLGSLSGCGLLDLNCDGNLEAVAPASMSSTRDVSFISSKRKRMWDGLQEPTISSKKKRKTTSAVDIDML